MSLSGRIQKKSSRTFSESIPESVLVTGGAGFIGSHLCETLLSRQINVICIDNFITGSPSNINEFLHNPGFTLIEFDLNIKLPEKLSKQIQKATSVYHLASPASPPLYRKFSIETLLVNSFGTYQMLEHCRLNNARFLLASTSEVYGNPKEHPQKEGYYGHVNPVGLRACYDEGKRFAEAITMEYFRKYHLDVRIARIFNTYGPRMQKDDGRVISNMIVACLSNKPLNVYGSGKQTRSFCYISDMVEGILKLMETDGLAGEVVNLGNNQEYSINETARLILTTLSSKAKIVHKNMRLGDDPDRRKPDITKAKELLFWSPTIPLTVGIKKTARFFST